jgi:2-polyprenyl-3-methyl-5-hydroxy-6-metoxy-1,4-benzoquinol methylase
LYQFEIHGVVTIYARDAAMYDAIYGGDDAAALEFIRWLLEFLEINNENDILDMGSGTGTLLIPLVKEGYNIQGVEPFDPMLNRAREKAEEAAVEINIRKGSFETLDDSEEYDLITAINGPLHYVEPENLHDVMKRVSTALKPGGRCVFDIINFHSIRHV